jgi:hypothetical protein
MARQHLSFLPDYDPSMDLAPFATLASYGRSQPIVGNASPAEQPGKSAEQYAQAAAVEKEKGNEDAAARLAVRASETRAQEFAGAGTPEPTSPLPQVAPASQAKGPTLSDGEELQAPMLAEASPWSALARYEEPARETTAEERYGQLGEPPEYEPPNQVGNMFALGLDTLFNKGRNAGRIVSSIAEGGGDTRYANWKRKADAAKAAADIEATKRRGLLTPEEEEYKRRRLEIAEAGLGLREKQIGAQGESLELRKQQEAVKNDPSHAGAERFRKQLEAEGAIRPGQWDGMSWEQMKAAGNEALKNRVDIAMAGELNAVAANKANAVANATDDNKIRVAEGISDATQANKLELVHEGQAGRIDAEDRADKREQSKRGEAFMQWYSKEAEKDLAIAKLMDGIDSAPGGVAPGMAERFKTWLTDRGISDDRVKPYMQKQMVLELWARQQSGAAISDSEEVRFAKQAASDPLASEEQINAAYEVMGDVISTWLRSKAAARPQEALTVGKAAGINADRWYGDMPVAPTAAPSQQPGNPPRQRPKRAPAKRGPRRQDFQAPSSDAEVIPEDDLEIY